MAMTRPLSEQVRFTQEGAGAVERLASEKLRETISVKDFGAVGDGVADDTAALQAALDSNQLVFVPAGKYRTTSTLLVDPIRNRNCGLIGLRSASRYPATTQVGGPTWDGTEECVIFYDGTTSATAAVLSASAEAVGTEPTSTFQTTVWTFIARDITFDANSKAGYGFFGARVQDLQMDHVRARGATVAGISINGTYSGSIRAVRCYLNPGRGLELGAADERLGWTVNDKVNAFYIYDLHCDANGSDSTFREPDPVLRKNNCGIYFGPHRGVHIYGAVSENNFGANVVFEPTGAGNTIQGLYTELGNKYAPGGAGTDAISLGHATKQWGVIFVGAAAAQNCRLVDGLIAFDHLWLTGTEPTPAREESGFEIYNCSLGGGVTADWGNYRLVNCGLELETITGTQPVGAYTIKGGLQFGAGQDILNFYGEGTFAPIVYGSTTPGTQGYSVQVGRYQRVGNMVHIQGHVIVNSTDSTATGALIIGGLPFTAANIGNYFAAVSVPYWLNITDAISGGSIAANTNYIELHRDVAGSVGTTVNATTITATTRFRFAATYQV